MNTLAPIYWPSCRWPLTLLREWIRDTWDGLPGPVWLRVLLIVACLAIPGPQDELLLLAVVAACRAIRKRRNSTSNGGAR